MNSTYRSKWLYGLKAQSLLVAGFLVCVVCCVLFFYTLPNQDRWIKSELTEASEHAMAQLAASIVSPMLSHQYAELYESLDAQLGEHGHWLRLKVEDVDGKKIYPLENWPLEVDGSDTVIYQDIYFLDKKLGRIVLVVNFYEDLAEGHRLQFTLALVLLATLMLVFGLVYHLINRTVIKPLRGLMVSFQQLANGEYHSRLPKVFNNEVANVVASFAEMRGNIQRNQTRLETLRQEAELANRAKSDFLSSMSHELRTPLNAILGLAQLFEYDDKASDEYKHHGKSIYNAGEYLLSLINDVLDLTLIESRNINLNVERFSISDVVSECVDLVASAASAQNIRLCFSRPVPDEIVVAGDYTRLKQSLLNLLSNAIKYNNEAGMVTVSYLRRDDCVRICIDDTGEGLAPEQIEKLFTRFDRLGAEMGTTQGTGIGLVITKELVELMGGKIGAASVVGQGSTFWVEMPLAIDERVPLRALPLENQPAVLPSITATGSTLRILVAEDNIVNQDVIRQQLSILGYQATFVGDGLEAWEYLQAGEFDALLTDIQMPQLNGYELTAQIRKAEEHSGRHLAIVAITANVMDSDVAACKSAGVDDFIPKPIEINVLREVLGKLDKIVAYTDDSSTATINSSTPDSDVSVVSSAIEISQLVSMVGDDTKTHCMIFKSFTATSPDNIKDILDAITARESENVYLQAHKFKSSARSMGAYSLADTCAELESCAHVTDGVEGGVVAALTGEQWQFLDTLAEKVQCEYAAAAQFIEAYALRHQ